MKRLLAFFSIVGVLSVEAMTMEAVQNAVATTESNKDFVLPSDSRFQRKWQNLCAAVSDGQPHAISLAFVLIDCTIMGGAEDGLLVDNLGLSAHNDSLSSACNGFISWADFAAKGVAKAEDQYIVTICETPHISISTARSDFKNEQMIQFLSKLLAAARTNPMSKEDELLAAINKRDCAAAREIIGRGFGSLNCELKGHWTPMSRAASLNHVEMLRLLRGFGATPDYALNGYWNNMQTACNNKAYDAVRYFVEECKLPIGDSLITAAQNGDMWLMKYFVGECHADANGALAAAKSKGQSEVVAYLESVGGHSRVKKKDEGVARDDKGVAAKKSEKTMSVKDGLSLVFDTFETNEEFRLSYDGALVMKGLAEGMNFNVANIRDDLLPGGAYLKRMSEAMKAKDLDGLENAARGLASSLRYKSSPKPNAKGKEKWSLVQKKAAELRDATVAVVRVKASNAQDDDAEAAKVMMGLFMGLATDNSNLAVNGIGGAMEGMKAKNQVAMRYANAFKDAYESYKEACVDYMMVRFSD